MNAAIDNKEQAKARVAVEDAVARAMTDKELMCALSTDGLAA